MNTTAPAAFVFFAIAISTYRAVRVARASKCSFILHAHALTVLTLCVTAGVFWLPEQLLASAHQTRAAVAVAVFGTLVAQVVYARGKRQAGPKWDRWNENIKSLSALDRVLCRYEAS